MSALTLRNASRGAHRTVVQVRPYNCTVYNGYGSPVHRPSTPVSRTPNGDGTGTKTAVLWYTVVYGWYLRRGQATLSSRLCVPWTISSRKSPRNPLLLQTLLALWQLRSDAQKYYRFSSRVPYPQSHPHPKAPLLITRLKALSASCQTFSELRLLTSMAHIFILRV